MKIAVNVIAFLFISSGALFVAAASARNRESMERAFDLQGESIRKTCIAGAGLLVVVEHKLERGDDDAEEMAKDVLAYGLPWLDLCARGPVFPLPSPDLLVSIRAIRADVTRWHEAP